MSFLRFTDNFSDNRYWTGISHPNTTSFISAPQSLEPEGLLISKRSYFGVSRFTIRFFDKIDDFFLKLSIGDREILRLGAAGAFYSVTEGTTQTVSAVSRSSVWHTILVEISDTYRVSIDGTLVATTTGPGRKAFDITLKNGRWDDLVIEREFLNDYQSGTGTLEDLKAQDIDLLSNNDVKYTAKPGYFYVDNIEYYFFGTMGQDNIEVTPSGEFTAPSGTTYLPGEPYFVVSEDDIISSESGIVRTPINKDYAVRWDEIDPPESGLYQPTTSGTHDSVLVYETAQDREFILQGPLFSTKLVLTDEGGTPAKVRSESTYIDHVKKGDEYEAFTEVLDQFGGPVEGANVIWKMIDANDVVSSVGASITNAQGIATTSITITEDGDFHIFSETNPQSQVRWIRVPIIVSNLIGIIFQLDNSLVLFDSRAARAAIGQNIWGDEWATNPGRATGLSFPNPTTRGQWENLHLAQQRPPDDEVLAINETDGRFNGHDFSDTYPGIVAGPDDVQTFMDPQFVARRGYWGSVAVDGADIRGGGPTIPSGQVINKTDVFEIDTDFGVTSGTYNDVLSAGGSLDANFYVFYQKGSDYIGSAVDSAGDFLFRGVAVYDEALSQSNIAVEDIINNATLQE